MGNESTHPTFLQSLLAGGLAGTSVDILFFPIDTVKTRLQSSQGFLKSGGFRGIYRGIGSVVIGSAPGAAVFFSTYDTLKQNLPLDDQNERTATLKYMISASCGEIAACLIRVPTEVIKTRAQTMSFVSGAQSSLSAAKMTIENGGFRGLYRGFGITVMREIPFTAIQFPLYEYLKRHLAVWLNRENKTLYPHEAAICGSMAGGFAAASTTPLDVIKTRIMLDVAGSNAKRKPPSAIKLLRNIYTQEGPKVLFSGVVPRTLWISAGGAVFLGVYEWAVHGLMSYT